MIRRAFFLAVVLLLTALTVANATVAVGGLFSDHTVLQRDKPCPVWGTAAPNKTITVVFNGQTKTTISDAQGNWRLSLDAMAAKATSGNMTITESGANTITVTDVVVGDVWMCGGQSNMAYNLGGSPDAATYTGIRWMWVNTGKRGNDRIGRPCGETVDEGGCG
jgi:sialate O-acetylesterase